MNLKSSKKQKLCTDLFSVGSLSFKLRHQLLKPRDSKSSYVINNPLHFIKNVKKESEYVDSLIKDIHFSPEVTAQRCVHLLPYDDRFYKTLYHVEIPKKQRSASHLVHPLPVRHKCKQFSNNESLSVLPPVRHHIGDKYRTDERHEKINEVSQEEYNHQKDKRYWDEYFLSLLSKETAQYIAFEACYNESQARRLQDLVEKWYGPTPIYRELIPNDKEENVEDNIGRDLKSRFPYKYYMDLVEGEKTGVVKKDKKMFINEPSQNKKISDLLSREISFYEENQQTDPYGNETNASFYRLPLLLRRQKKNTEIFHNDSGNKTAVNLADFRLPETPLRRLDTVLNPKIGDKVLMTNNQFQQDLLLTTEIKQEKVISAPDDVIKIEDKIYRKSLQPIWPAMIFSGMPSEDNLNSFRHVKTHVIKGHNRWTNLPEKEETNLKLFEENESLEEKVRLNSRKKLRENSAVNLIVDQWRKKWQLTQKYSDSTIEDLLKDMGDVHPTIRMQAIVTVAKSGINQESPHDDQDISNMKGRETIKSSNVPEVLLKSIEILLDDSHQQVRKAAAVALHSLEKHCEKSFKILRDMLASGSAVDRWTSAQCLALSNVCDSHVISILVDQLMNSEDFLIHEKASLLLAKISVQTKLVHGMLGEKLNTISWRQRIIICKTLPLLHGSLNKDILKKLIFLMWQDEHKEVRIAASQVLGKTGNGKAVHDELIAKLQNQSEIVRADALEKIGILKVMTTRMMPAFIKAFSDDFVIVRKEVCLTCYKLAIQDELCINKLLEIAKHDPSKKVKIYSLRALGKIRVELSETRSCFIWALQYESEVKVRYEAMRSLLISNSLDQEIVDLLMSRFLVEDDYGILKLIRKTLNNVGINPDEDIDAVAEVRTEVKRFLSDKNRINDLILLNEGRDDYFLQRELMIAPSGGYLNQEDNLEREESFKTLQMSSIAFEGRFSQLSEEDEKEEKIHNKEDVRGNKCLKEAYVETTGNIEEKENYEDQEIDEEDEKETTIVNENREISECSVCNQTNDDGGLVQKETSSVKDKQNEIEQSSENQNDINDLQSETNCEKETNILKEETIPEGKLTINDLDDIQKTKEGNNNDIEDSEDIPNERKIDEDQINVLEEMNVNKDLSENLSKTNENENYDVEEEDSSFTVEMCEAKKIKTEQELKKENDFIDKGKDNNISKDLDESEEDVDSLALCKYQLQLDASHLKAFTEEKSMSWITLTAPTITIKSSQLEMLEKTLSPTLMEEVNSAIEYEGIDCSCEEL